MAAQKTVHIILNDRNKIDRVVSTAAKADSYVKKIELQRGLQYQVEQHQLY